MGKKTDNNLGNNTLIQLFVSNDFSERHLPFQDVPVHVSENNINKILVDLPMETAAKKAIDVNYCNNCGLYVMLVSDCDDVIYATSRRWSKPNPVRFFRETEIVTNPFKIIEKEAFIITNKLFINSIEGNFEYSSNLIRMIKTLYGIIFLFDIKTNQKFSAIIKKREKKKLQKYEQSYPPEYYTLLKTL